MATTETQLRLTREILVLGGVVILGMILAILDATIVNVAIPTLGRDFHTSISTIQWVMTAYLLAFASVIPLTGWAAGEFGPKRVWLAAPLPFLAGAARCCPRPKRGPDGGSTCSASPCSRRGSRSSSTACPRRARPAASAGRAR